MEIRKADPSDMESLSRYDNHIRKEELQSILSMGRILIAEQDGGLIGWLRWNLFWDSIPFMNMLFFLEGYRNCGYGKALVTHWERLIKEEGYEMVMTSSLANEEAQHFYRKLGYIDSGALLLPQEPLEIIFTKRM